MKAPDEPGSTGNPTAAALADRLAAIALSGDRAAFADLFRYYAPRIKAYLMKLGGEPGMAEELMQEAMVTVWRKASQFDPAKSAPSTWVFAIARNLRIDAYRHQRRPEFDPADPTLVPDAELPADAGLVRAETATRLRHALGALSPDEQTLLRMAYYDDKSQTRISGELGIPLGTVKSRVRLAFARLRAALTDPDQPS